MSCLVHSIIAPQEQHFGDQVDQISAATERHQQQLEEIGNLLLQLRKSRSDAKGGSLVDLSLNEEEIARFCREVWPIIQKDFPDYPLNLDSLEGVNIKKVPIETVDHMLDELTLMQQREERQIPRDMLKLESLSEMHRIILDILRKCTEEESSQTRTMIYNQIPRSR